ncbi:hypothetical protein AB6T38_09220 [Aliiglaciecola sp. SL4]|uniref:hypothetical protein n=1 Tax=Aliiglaciecola sp. SL4 TaxID=3239806 RepID=UPI00355BA4EE
MKKTLLCSAILLALTACSGSDADESETDSSTSNSSPSVDAGSDTSTDEDTKNDSSVWIINETGELSKHILDSKTGIGVEVDVQSVEVEEIDGKEYTVVTSQGIPNYETLITDDILDGLSGRPKASSDFVNGYPSVEMGDSISFGEDVGYVSNSNCTLDYGYGYWPPGPECPTQDERTVYLPMEPKPTEEECKNGLSKVGIMVHHQIW